MQRFGRLDTLVNNAGVSAQALFEDVSAQDLHWYEDLMKVNLWGSVWCTHAALPHLKATRGRLVAVSSLSGLLGVPGRSAYAATKFAMTGFFEALRAEMKSAGVSVTIAYPGVVSTKLRHRGYNARGEAAGFSGLKEDGAMTVEECARLIVDGIPLTTPDGQGQASSISLSSAERIEVLRGPLALLYGNAAGGV